MRIKLVTAVLATVLMLIPAAAVLANGASGVETNVFPNAYAEVMIIIPGDAAEFIPLQGPTTVVVRHDSLGDPDGNGLDQVQTEIVSMQLIGASLNPGLVELRLYPGFGPSVGQIEELGNPTPGSLDYPADSFFDVFFEIEVPALYPFPMIGQVPNRLVAVVNGNPPIPGTIFTGVEGPVPLLDPDGTPTGFMLDWPVFIPGQADPPTPIPPISDPNGPYTGFTGQPVSFDGTGSWDPDGTIVSYDWDFGDSSTGTGATPTHTYASPGTPYTVTLTVTDDSGLTDTASTTADITVGTPIPPSVPGLTGWGIIAAAGILVTLILLFTRRRLVRS